MGLTSSCTGNTMNSVLPPFLLCLGFSWLPDLQSNFINFYQLNLWEKLVFFIWRERKFKPSSFGSYKLLNHGNLESCIVDVL